MDTSTVRERVAPTDTATGRPAAAVPRRATVPARDPDDLAALCAALADPARLGIVRALARGEADAGSLARGTRSSPSATSNRLAALEGAGLVEARAEGRRRVYRLRHPETRRVLARMEAFAAICAASASMRTRPKDA